MAYNSARWENSTMPQPLNVDSILANQGSGFADIFTGAAGGAAAGTMALPGLGTAIGAGVGLLNGLINYFGADKQLKAARETQKQQLRLYEQQREDENNRYAQNFAEDKRRFEIQNSLSQNQMGMQNALANRTLDLQGRQIDAQVAQSKAERADALRQKRITDRLDMLSGLTHFFNTPAARAQYAAFWR